MAERGIEKVVRLVFFLAQLLAFVGLVVVGLRGLHGVMRGVIATTARIARAVVLGTAATVAAVLAGLGTGAVAALAGADQPVPLGLVAGLAAFAATLFLGRRRREPADRTPAGPSPDLPPERDAAVAAAWDEAAVLAPRERERLRTARRACARLAEAAAQGGLDPALIDCAVFVERAVPELAATTRAMLAGADRAERAALVAGLVEDLERLGARAAAEVQRARSPVQDRHAAVRAHVARRTGEDREGPAGP